ncbi:MAG: glycerol-3-phosphate transporter, partial [Alphaproteobacteria bacterium]|nr:glycerol-3-phosphate transporter [Alphaproteobacteria bacterium]
MVERQTLFARILPHVVLITGVCIVAFPVYLALLASTYDAGTVQNGRMTLLPGDQMLENYERIIFSGARATTREPVGTMLMNSFIMAMVIALGKIAISLISAYAIVFFRFPFRMAAFWLIFVTLMLPVEVRIYPTYKIVADLQLLDTYT